MTDREIMKQALDVLERVALHLMRPQDVDVMQALRAQLEQPKGLFIDMIAAHGPKFVEQVRRVGENIEQQADPVAWVFAPNNELLWPSEVEVTNPIEIDSYQPLYTAPPQRQWVGLTAEDLAQIESDEFWQVGNHMAIALAVEDKLKEKNHD